MCTIFTISKNGEVFFCNNEDNQRNTDETFIAFFPPQNFPSEWIFPDTTDTLNSFGFVLVGVRKGDKLFPQGGMNEYGLAYDINALSNVWFKGIEGKAWIGGFNYFDLLMINKDITDILNHYQTYYQSAKHWGAGQIHFADATGQAMVAGITKNGELGFTFMEDKRYLLSTNFSLLNPDNKEGYPCQRYDKAEEMLEQLVKKDQISVGELTNILDAVKLEYGKLGPNIGTVYSNVCDLTRKELYLYHLHDFSKVKKFDLTKELKNEYKNRQEFIFADNAEKERFTFEKMHVYIIVELFH